MVMTMLTPTMARALKLGRRSGPASGVRWHGESSEAGWLYERASGSGAPASYQPLAVSGGGTWSSVTNHYYYQ